MDTWYSCLVDKCISGSIKHDFDESVVGSSQSLSHFSPLTSEVVGAPQMTLQEYLSTLPCLPLPSGNLQTPFPSIPWCYLPIFSSVFLSFLLLHCPLQNCLRHARGSWDVGHTIWVSVSLPWLGNHHALQLHPGFCCEPPRSSHGLKFAVFLLKCENVNNG